MGEMTLADIAAVTDRDNNAFGGNNGGMWIFALLILLMMGGGYWNKGNQNGGGEPVTESGLCSAMNFNGLENSVERGKTERQPSGGLYGTTERIE